MKPQTRLVLDYLLAKGNNGRRRTVTTAIAMNSIGVGSLSSRIAELRSLGYVIKDEWRKDYYGARYKRYRLEGEPRG